MRENPHLESHSRPRPEANGQSGYTLLMVVFLVATMLLVAVAATPSVVIEGRRQKEQEDVWRGNQYVRAIRLYYQKNGRYPQTLDDLTKPDVNGNHFLRKTYADLMNTEDGKWRMIYVSPSGQLIGSVRYHSLQEMALAQGLGVPPTVAGTTTGMPSTGQTAQAAPSGQANQFGVGQAGQGQAAGQQPAFGSSTQPQSLAPLEPVDGPVLGGFLIGVGGKEKRPSLMVYQGGKTYYEWEFIWNPLASGISIGVPQPAAGAAGAAPNGTTPPNGVAPTGVAPNGAAPTGTAPVGGVPPDSNSAPGNPANPTNPSTPASPSTPGNPAPDNPAAPANPPDPNAPASAAPSSTQ